MKQARGTVLDQVFRRFMYCWKTDTYIKPVFLNGEKVPLNRIVFIGDTLEHLGEKWTVE